MDPYVYPNSHVLINRLNIQDEQNLITFKTQLLIGTLLEIQPIAHTFDLNDYLSLKAIHQFLFEDVYTWAGGFRTVNFINNVHTFIDTSDYTKIDTDLNAIFKWANLEDWTHENPQLPTNFTKFMMDIWRIHPFRDGNTMTVSVYMKLLADEKGISFNAELIAQNADSFRNALVMATREEAPEPNRLYEMIRDTLRIDEK